MNHTVLDFSSKKVVHLEFFSGVLASLDGYMNIALEQTEEYVNGQLKNKFEDAFIRGNNGKETLQAKLFYSSIALTTVSLKY